MLSPLDRAGYIARQGARVAWYMGHYIAGRRLQSPQAASAKRKKPGRPSKPRNSRSGGLTRQAVLADMADLFARDLANVARGDYPMPRDDDGGPLRLLARSRAFFRDLPRVDARRREGRNSEVFAPAAKDGLPRYYLQNFHYQTGGYLTQESAALYDTQVEVLFNGSANAMRRQALVPLAAELKGRDQRRLALLDVACGTGRFARFVKEAWPRLGVTGLDLSAAYLSEARDHLAGFSKVDFLEANAEAMPVEDSSQDVVTSVYLFHELPPKVRRTVAREIARVLKPGGLFILVDSLQTGDRPAYDGLLDGFEVAFHEPYFSSYVAEDFAALFADAGLAMEGQRPAFLSKVMTFRKPAEAKGKTSTAGRKPKARADAPSGGTKPVASKAKSTASKAKPRKRAG